MSTPGVEKIIYVSPAYEKIWGRTCESLYESPQAFIEAVHPEDAENVKSALSGHAKGFWDLEYRIIRRDGTICWVRNRGFAVRDAQDNITVVTGALTDITQRKQMEDSLRNQAKTMDAFFEHTITPIVFLDRNFNFVRVSEAYARACQRNISEFEGHNHFEFYPHEGNQRIFEEVVRTKTPYEARAKPFSFPDHPEWGVTYWDWTLVPILDSSGEVEFLVFSLEDVTDRKKSQDTILADREQLRRLSSELLMVEERERRKLAIDLHDSVGQILALLKIELGTMRRSALPSESSRALKHVLEHVKDAIEQTRTLTFEISPPELYTIGLESAIEELARRFAEERNLQWYFEASGEPITLSEHVKICLYRSVRELLINTVKHAEAKTVSITTRKVDNDIQITVEDDGKGFNVSELKKSSGAGSGGLGLLGVRERLQHIGGKLVIQSGDGLGTRITLIAPLENGIQAKEH
jgi:PAS domain S-box-containing protein